jgi:hypothetical protein
MKGDQQMGQKKLDKKEAEFNALGVRANELCDLVGQAQRNAIEYARQCGEVLTKMKDLVGHGCWEQWIYKHFNATLRTAEHYMEIYRDCDKGLSAAIEEGTASTSIRGATAWLRAKDRQANGSAKSDYEVAVQQAAREITRAFAAIKGELCGVETLLFRDLFTEIDNPIWDNWCKRFRKAVLEMLRYDPRKSGHGEAFYRQYTDDRQREKYCETLEKLLTEPRQKHRQQGLMVRKTA